MTIVLLVENDPITSEPLACTFGHEGYKVLIHGAGKGALEEASATNITVLDLGLSDIDGLDAIRQVRTQDLATPVLMLIARSKNPDPAIGLGVGTDDYITKLFHLTELLARMWA